VSESDGVWSQPTEISLPTGYNTDPNHQIAYLLGVTCLSAGNCVGAGYYEDSTGSIQAMAVTSVPTLAVATSSLPIAVAGAAHSAQLSTSGGAGNDTEFIRRCLCRVPVRVAAASPSLVDARPMICRLPS
jgi:hypothetical protein